VYLTDGGHFDNMAGASRRIFLPKPFIERAMSGVRHSVHRPAGALRRYVREILWIRSEHPRPQMLLPETTLTLVLRQSGRVSLHSQDLPCAIVSGLQQRTRVVEHAAHSSFMVVRFTEVGAPAILHDRADLLYNRTLPLEDVLPRQPIEHVQNVLAGEHSIQRQFAAVERFLSSRIQPRNGTAISPQIEAAVDLIRRTEGRVSVAAIARHAAMSESALERHFRAAVGATPKIVSRVARLQHVCRLWDAGKTLTEIAFAAGYSDQPHMVHDFRLFTGASPEAFFRQAAPRNLPTFYK
jgi:AraC-like DNA-binding protein